jgi:hypothetical protein
MRAGKLVPKLAPVLGGVAAVTDEVGEEVADPEPDAFEAVTVTRKACPWSVEVAIWLAVVAPATAVQAAPVASHSCHW